MPEKQVIPPAIEDVFNWAGVVLKVNDDNALRNLLLVHKSAGANGYTEDEVQIHLQGFVISCNLRALGTWRSKLVRVLDFIQWLLTP